MPSFLPKVYKNSNSVLLGVKDIFFSVDDTPKSVVIWTQGELVQLM